MDGIKQMIMSVPALFNFEKLKYFFHSLGSWEGWQEIEFR